MSGSIHDLNDAVSLVIYRQATGQEASVHVAYLRSLHEQAQEPPHNESFRRDHEIAAILHEYAGDRDATIRERLHKLTETESWIRDYWGDRDPSGLKRRQVTLRKFIRSGTPTWSGQTAPPTSPISEDPSDPDDHFDFVHQGLYLNEERRYAGALISFEQAIRLCPDCPHTQYNRANTLHNMHADTQAFRIFQALVQTPDATLRAGCPDSVQTPRTLRLDALYMMFVTSLYATNSWAKSTPHLRQHLRQRTKGLRSIWTKQQVIEEADEMRESFSPRAKSVRDWVL